MNWIAPIAYMLLVGLIGCFGMSLIIQWHTKQMARLTRFSNRQIESSNTTTGLIASGDINHLQQRINDLQLTVGSVVQGLQAVNNQVQQVSTVTHNVATHLASVASQFNNSPQVSGIPQLLVQVKADIAAGKPLTFDDLPLDAQKKIRLFHAVHSALQAQESWPSRQSPDLN